MPEPTKAKDPKSTSDLVTVYIPSHNIEVRSRKVDGRVKKFIYGAINSVPFELPCDEAIQIEPHLAEHLAPYIKG